ncbi:MAG: HAD-IA family hydrolase [Chloroflexi bacterium]|nr:HAD-IA family hydrolase [Chloroflexota bacterium]
MSEAARAADRTPPRAVLLDLDGTLLDSLGSVAEAMVETLGRHGHRVTRAEVLAVLGHSLPQVITDLTALPRDEALRVADDYRALYYDRYYRRAEPCPGAGALLAGLGAAAVPLALVTSRRERYAHFVLAHLGWTAHFPVVVGQDTAAAPKPDPAPVLHALAALGADAAGSAFVGDTNEDMAAARDAGVGMVVGLTHIRRPEELRASGATHLAAGLDAVGALLGLPLAVPGGAA